MKLLFMLLNVAGIWIGCGVLARGFILAHFQTRYALIAEESYAGTVAFARFMSIFGPCTLLGLAVSSLDRTISRLSEGCCPICGESVKHRQVGSCVYGVPCGHRLYQGKINPQFAE